MIFHFIESLVHQIIGFSIFSLISLGLQNIFSSLSGSKSSKSNSFREKKEESSAPHPPLKKNLLSKWYFWWKLRGLYGVTVRVTVVLPLNLSRLAWNTKNTHFYKKQDVKFDRVPKTEKKIGAKEFSFIRNKIHWQKNWCESWN